MKVIGGGGGGTINDKVREVAMSQAPPSPEVD